MILQMQAPQLQTPAMAVVRPPSSTFSLAVPLGVSKHFSPHNVQTHSSLSSNTFSAVSHFIPNAFHLHLPSKLVQSSLRRQSTKPIHRSLPQKQSSLSPLVGAGFSLALLASTATIAGGTAFAADFPLLGSSSLQLSEPQNALSLPTRAIHVSSVIEWITAMALVWKYGERPVYDSWKGLSWGMNRKITLEVLPSQNDCGDMDTNSVEFSLNSQDCKDSSFSDASAFEISFRSWLKFLMLMGFFTLQGSHQAVAGSGFAAGLPSVPDLGDLGDINTGFASAFLLIFFSELGDKTFFIAALLAARNSGAIIFVGTFGALAAMSIISVVIGRTFHYVDDILPFRFGETDLPIDDIAAVGLLTYFGVSTLIEAASNDGPKAEEEQKEAELAVSEFSGNGAGILAAASTVISTFVLVFVAEWGDKSFFSTIALAAASSPLGVIGGAVAGHAVATLLAVLGGSLLGTFLSEKVIAYVGGTLFLVFAAVTLVEIVT